MSYVTTIERAELVDDSIYGGLLVCQFVSCDFDKEDIVEKLYFLPNAKSDLDELRRRLDEVVYPMDVDCLDEAYRTARKFLADNYMED